jgi:hypothetical protein
MGANVGPLRGRRGLYLEVLNRQLHDNGSLHSNLAQLFPHLQAMDGNIGIYLEPQSDLPTLNLEHRDLEHALEANGPSNHD